MLHDCCFYVHPFNILFCRFFDSGVFLKKIKLQMWFSLNNHASFTVRLNHCFVKMVMIPSFLCQFSPDWIGNSIYEKPMVGGSNEGFQSTKKLHIPCRKNTVGFDRSVMKRCIRDRVLLLFFFSKNLRAYTFVFLTIQ